MRLIYSGPLAGPLDLPTLDVVEFDTATVLEVDDVAGLSLCEQVDWSPADDESQAKLDAFCEWVKVLTDTHVRVYDFDVDEFVWQPLEQPDDVDSAPAPEPEPKTPRPSRPRATATTTDESTPADAGDEGNDQ